MSCSGSNFHPGKGREESRAARCVVRQGGHRQGRVSILYTSVVACRYSLLIRTKGERGQEVPGVWLGSRGWREGEGSTVHKLGPVGMNLRVILGHLSYVVVTLFILHLHILLFLAFSSLFLF